MGSLNSGGPLSPGVCSISLMTGMDPLWLNHIPGRGGEGLNSHPHMPFRHSRAHIGGIP